MTISKFELNVGATGQGSVVLDGVDISAKVTGLSLVSRPREVTKLTLELVADGPVEGFGEVLVVRSSETLTAFLANIDPDELEQAALARLGGLGDGSLTAAMLTVLAEWADGR